MRAGRVFNPSACYILAALASCLSSAVDGAGSAV